MPYSAHSAANDRVRWCTAALEALYAGCHCGRLTIAADMEPMLTMAPPPWSFMWRAAARLSTNRARTLRSKTEDHSSSVTSNEAAW